MTAPVIPAAILSQLLVLGLVVKAATAAAAAGAGGEGCSSGPGGSWLTAAGA